MSQIKSVVREYSRSYNQKTSFSRVLDKNSALLICRLLNPTGSWGFGVQMMVKREVLTQSTRKRLRVSKWTVTWMTATK